MFGSIKLGVKNSARDGPSNAPVQILISDPDSGAGTPRTPQQPKHQLVNAPGSELGNPVPYVKADWDFSLQEGLTIAFGFAYKFFQFWVAMALLVAATDSHQWVSQFKTAICVVAAIVSLVCIVGIQNFMSKKFVFYKLLQHKVVLQFETKPPTRLCGVPCPAFVPAQYLDAAAVTLIVLVLGTLIIGLAMFGYSATDGTSGVKSIRWAKLGGTAGASLAAVFILLQYAGMVRVYNCLIPFSVVLADDPVDFSTAPSKKAWVQGVTCVKEKDFKRMVVALIFKHKAAAPRSAQSTGSSEPRPGHTLVERYKQFAEVLHHDPTAAAYSQVPEPPVSDCCGWISFKLKFDWFLFGTICENEVGDDAAEQNFLSRNLARILACFPCFKNASSIATACFFVVLSMLIASGYGFLQNQAQKTVVCPTGYTCILNAVQTSEKGYAPAPALY